MKPASRARVLRGLVLICFACVAVLAVMSVGAQGSDREHVGAITCAGCHTSEHEIWRETPHSTSFERLSGSRRDDPACLQCHAPAREDGLSGIQCETCHGGGRYYFADYVMRDAELARLVGLRDPDESTCASCHDADNTARLVPFDFETAKERIRHW